jgi:hypothetical protein
MNNPIPLNTLPDLFPDFAELSRFSGSWLATLGVGLAVGLPMSAAADPLEEPRSLPTEYRWFDAESDRPPAWLGEDVHYKKGSGLEYRREMKFGETPIELGFQGPVVRKKKSLGLTVEVRF